VSRSQRLSVALGVNLALGGGARHCGAPGHSTSLLADAPQPERRLRRRPLVGRGPLGDPPAQQHSLVREPPGHHPRRVGERSRPLRRDAVIVVLSIDRLVHRWPSGRILVVMASWPWRERRLRHGGRDGTHDLNMRSVFLHMTADVLSAAFVLVAGLILLVSGGSSWSASTRSLLWR